MIAIIFFILFQIAVVGALILFYGKVAAEAQSWLNGLLEDLRVNKIRVFIKYWSGISRSAIIDRINCLFAVSI